jgi:hypothetical protein
LLSGLNPFLHSGVKNMWSLFRKLVSGIEKLEGRELMAVDISVVNGDLYIKGTASGEIAIVDLGDGTLQITESGAGADGSEVVTVESGVSDDIIIRLDSDGSSTNDIVTVDLSAASLAVDKIFASLGEGDNSFSILGGTIGGTVAYSGRSGSDTVSIAKGVVVEGNLLAALGDGENSLSMDGALGRSLGVRGGVDADSVSLGNDSVVAGLAMLLLGDGDNSVEVSGEIDKSLCLQSGSGDDTLTLTESALNEGSVTARLGSGSNSASVDGVIGGDLAIVSLNQEDELVVADNAVIVGDTLLGAGEQFEGRRRGRGGMHAHSHR